MPLPTIETPTYELKLPSSNKKVKYRPFLVKEEKILIIALESKNQNEITNAVTDVLKKCILTKGVDVDNLPTFDIEFLFLNIRSKSIGEDIKLTVTCPDDNTTKVPVTIYVDEIKVVKPRGHTKDIKLDEKYIQSFLDKRKPGQNKYTTQRNEPDSVEILSGVFEGVSTGTPIQLLIKNTDQRSKDYSEIAQTFRPGHADVWYSRLPWRR